jgi:hypothetical protein
MYVESCNGAFHENFHFGRGPNVYKQHRIWWALPVPQLIITLTRQVNKYLDWSQALIMQSSNKGQ